MFHEIKSKSPYSVSYRSNLTQDQRELIAHRTCVTKLSRSELEDRYITLLDEHFLVKKENQLSHDKIRKLVTKIMRLSGETNVTADGGGSARHLTVPRAHLTHEEELQIRIVDLESYNSQLKTRLNTVLATYRAQNPVRSRCASATPSRATSSTTFVTSMPSKEKLLSQSHDNIPFLMQKSSMTRHRDGFRPSSRGPGAYRKRGPTPPSPLTPPPQQLDRNDSIISTAVEDNIPETVDEQEDAEEEERRAHLQEIGELKSIVAKLQQESEDDKSVDTIIAADVSELDRKKFEAEIKATQLAKYETEMQQKMAEFEKKIAAIQRDTEHESEMKRTQIFELTVRLDQEMEKNRQLIREKEMVIDDLNILNIAHQENADVQAENNLLKRHRENIAMLATELAARSDRIKLLCKDNELMRADLVDAKTSITTLNSCNGEMMQKVQMLQDSNDLLTVHLEGIKAQCQCLADFNVLIGGGGSRNSFSAATSKS